MQDGSFEPSPVALKFAYWTPTLPVHELSSINIHGTAYALSISTELGASGLGGDLAFSVPITDVELASGHSVRGMPFMVGTPRQKFAASVSTWPNLELASSAEDFEACPLSLTIARCDTYYGGLFNTTSSLTFEARDNVTDAGYDEDTFRGRGDLPYLSVGVDRCVLGNASLADFPFAMSRDKGLPLAKMGIGRDSPLLTRLKESGHIGSRSYGYWHGLDAYNTQMDGAVVFGGYDAAKTSGDNLTFQLTEVTLRCPSGMRVKLTDICMFREDRADIEFHPFREPEIEACLDIGTRAFIILPKEPYFQMFEVAVNGTQFYNGPLSDDEYAIYRLNRLPLVEAGRASELSMSIHSGGLIFNASNDVLVRPAKYLEPDGTLASVNSTSQVSIGLFMGETIYNTSFILGDAFLSAAYVFVNYDANTFTLWRANATEAQELVAVGGDSADCEDEDQDSASSVSTGAIAGATVGGAVGASLIAAAIYFFRRHKRGRASKQSSTNNTSASAGSSEGVRTHGKDGVKGVNVVEVGDSGIAEAPAMEAPQEADSRPLPAEMGEGRRETYELPGHNT
ncbi:hypothetical protein MBLNU230_g4509t1 [Neophaeotheca triangularis]